MDKDKKRALTEAYKRREVVGGVYAVVSDLTGKRLIDGVSDLAGARNRHEFALKTGTILYRPMQTDMKAQGVEHFSFEVLEELKKKEDQSPADFRADIEALTELWKERYDPADLYG